MSAWKKKRFWKEAAVVADAGGFAVALDGRALRTPAKAPVNVPTRALAGAIAEEWNAQQDDIDPLSMPVTRAANAAIDKVMPQIEEVARLTAAYGANDLLCYRAEGPEALVARQKDAWDPLLDWAERELGAPLIVTGGVMHRAQPEASLARLSARVHALAPFPLTALHELVALSGSLIIGLAATAGQDDPAALWQLSRIDETWQAELWGRDEEAEAQARLKERDFLRACRFYDLCQASG